MDVNQFLDSKFPTFESLKSNLDTESQNVKAESDKIAKQIELEQQQSIKARQQAASKLQTYFKSISESVMQRVPSDRDLNDCLKDISSSGMKQQVTENFQHLQTLTKGHQVILRLAKIQQGCENVRQNMNTPEQKIEAYQSLLEDERGLAVFSGSSNPVISTLANKGLQQFESTVRKPLRDQYKKELRDCLADSHWPKATPTPKTFIRLFVNILRTERPHHSFEKTDQTTANNSIPRPLEAFSVLAEQYDIRFRFHFEGDRETNRLDKPEWAFEHFKSTIDEQLNFLESCVRPALSEVERFADRSAVNEFITAMLPSVYRMLRRAFPEVLDSPKLLSHLVYQCEQFDQMLQRGGSGGYYYTPYGQRNGKWRGITGDMLAQNDWFEKWLSTEKEYSLSRYTEIVETPTSFEIDFESVDPGETKPTYSAMNLKDLLEGITEHYDTLKSVNYRLRFLLDIQIDILDRYYNRILESISAFDSLTSSLTRSIGGISAEDQKRVSGINGLERLCRLYGSVEYIRAALESWGQELFFLTLWEDISKLSAKNKKLHPKVSHAIEDKSSNIPQHEDDEGTLFDETIASYSKLKDRLTSTLRGLLKKELQASMHEYFRTSDWKNDDESQVEVSPKLVQPIKTLSSQLSFLKRFHSANDYTRLCKGFSKDLEKYMWNYVIQANTFSPRGSEQLAKDVAELWTSLQLNRDASFRRLEQASILLNSEVSRAAMDESKLRELDITDLSLHEARGILERRL